MTAEFPNGRLGSDTQMKLRLKNFGENILLKFPGFKESKYFHQDDEDLPYMLINGFADYLLNLYRETKLDNFMEVLNFVENELIFSKNKKLVGLGAEFTEHWLSNLDRDEYQDLLSNHFSFELKRHFEYWEAHGFVAGPKTRT